MHRPELAEKWSDLGVVLRFGSSFTPRLREFVILLTGRYWDCQFEWFSHEAEARKAGLSEQSIETLRHGGSTFAATDAQAIHDYAMVALTLNAYEIGVPEGATPPLPDLPGHGAAD